jgi:alpha-beta hydrolase superfamily lysophospholipase
MSSRTVIGATVVTALFGVVVEIENREDVRFSSGNIQLAGTLISPSTNGKNPAIILVHGSGAEDREHILPWARFLIRRGMAVFGYDKRGVGASAGTGTPPPSTIWRVT